MGIYDKKILFNINQTDLDRMTDMRTKRGLDQSEYIRRAIRMYFAEHKLEELRRGAVKAKSPERARPPARIMENDNENQ